MTAREAVEAFINAANELRRQDDMDVCFALLGEMVSRPISTSYALYVPAETYRTHVKARLPEGTE